MRIALIGYGSIAEAHVQALQQIGGVEFWVVVGRLPEPTAAFAQRFGFRFHTTDLATALSDLMVEAVVVCSPTDLHAQQTAQALEAGKHVLCEIPLATSLAETDRLIALADRQDRRLMVCHTQRYWPTVQRARQAVADGLFVHHMVARYLFLRRENVNWRGRRRSWTDNLLWHHGCHAVDTVLWLLGAETVTVSGHVALPSRHLGIPMDIAIVLRTPQDQLATIALSYNSHLALHDYLLIGEQDTLLVTPRRLEHQAGLLYDQATADPLESAIVQQDREFLAAVREGREPAISGRAVRPTMAVLQAVQDQFAAWAPPGALHPVP